MSQTSTEGNATGRATRIVLFVSAVLGLATGLATGVPEGRALAVRLFSRRTLAVERELSTFSAVQFQHADAEHARQAVLSEIRVLDSLPPQHANSRRAGDPAQHLAVRPPNQPLYNQALYIAYARLVLIEEAAGLASAAQSAQAKAAEQWRSLHPTLHPGGEITPEQMKQAVRDFDSSIDRLRF